MKKVLVLVFTILSSLIWAEDNKAMSVKELYQIVQAQEKGKKQEFVILDVRTAHEVKSTGVIKGAIVKNAHDHDMLVFLKKLDKTKRYAVYCHSGVRSAYVVEMLGRLGMTAHNVEAGIVGWQRNRFPLEKK
jgi:rhodanese-related sulfurtransferase